MKPTVMLLAALLLAGGARAGDVYVTKDAQGHPVYTDTPQTVPAQKVGVASTSTDAATAQQRYSDEMKKYAADDDAYRKAAAQQADAAKAKQLSAEDMAKRCADARDRYQLYVQSQRLYEQAPDGQRRYLSNDEIDAARANAKKLMDEFCSGQ